MLAYVDGINDCVAKMKILPLDFKILGLKWQNWTIAKSFGIHKLVEWSQAMNIGE
jgi:acyl-homoserine lactone acylase PvdQ